MNKVLLVDDEHAISKNNCNALPNNLTVDFATNVKTARKMLSKQSYALCLLDIRPPGLSGMEFYKILKEKYPMLTIKVIITTGDTKKGKADSFCDCENRPLLPKPFTTNELIAIVSETLREAAR